MIWVAALTGAVGIFFSARVAVRAVKYIIGGAEDDRKNKR